MLSLTHTQRDYIWSRCPTVQNSIYIPGLNGGPFFLQRDSFTPGPAATCRSFFQRRSQNDWYEALVERSISLRDASTVNTVREEPWMACPFFDRPGWGVLTDGDHNLSDEFLDHMMSPVRGPAYFPNGYDACPEHMAVVKPILYFERLLRNRTWFLNFNEKLYYCSDCGLCTRMCWNERFLVTRADDHGYPPPYFSQVLRDPIEIYPRGDMVEGLCSLWVKTRTTARLGAGVTLPILRRNPGYILPETAVERGDFILHQFTVDSSEPETDYEDEDKDVQVVIPDDGAIFDEITVPNMVGASTSGSGNGGNGGNDDVEVVENPIGGGGRQTSPSPQPEQPDRSDVTVEDQGVPRAQGTQEAQAQDPGPSYLYSPIGVVIRPRRMSLALVANSPYSRSQRPGYLIRHAPRHLRRPRDPNP